MTSQIRPVLWRRFHEATGAGATLNSGSGGSILNGAPTNITFAQAGQLGSGEAVKCRSFNNVDVIADASSIASLPAFTWGFLFQATGAGGADTPYLASWGNDNTARLGLATGGTIFEVRIKRASVTATAETNAILNLGAWYWAFVTFDVNAGTAPHVYIAQTTVTEATYSSTAVGSGALSAQGTVLNLLNRTGQDHGIVGQVDEIFEVDRVLTTTEMQTLVNASRIARIAPTIYPTITVAATKTIRTSASSPQYFAFPVTAVLGTGRVVMIYSRGTANSNGAHSAHISLSGDYGATWSAEDTDLSGNPISGWPLTAPAGFSDPNATFDESEVYLLNDGSLLVHTTLEYWNTGSFYGTYQSKSTDGVTWTAPAAITFTGAADSNKIRSCGDFTLVGSVIYAAVEQKSSPEQCLLVKSANGTGNDWAVVSSIGSAVVEAGLEYVDNNTFTSLLRVASTVAADSNRSSDLGLTWQGLTNLIDQMPSIIRPRMKTAAHIRGEANWWTDKHLIAWGAVQNGSNRQNCVFLSEDGGLNWTEPIYVDSSALDGGYGDIFWNPTAQQYVYVCFKGVSSTQANLVQYNFTVNWIT